LGVGALASIWRVAALLRTPSPLFVTTVNELRRDEAALRGDGDGETR
jgi:hypothetical protein